MRRTLLTLGLVLLCGQLVGGFTYPTGSGGSIVGGDTAEQHLVYVDLNTSTFTQAQCLSLLGSGSGSATCTTDSTRYPVAHATILTRWEVLILDTVNANSGCTFTLVSSVGDVVTTTKPMLGDQAVVGRTLLAGANPGYSEAIPSGVNATIPAGGWVQVRVNDEATGSAGDDGSCANAVTGNIQTAVQVFGIVN